MNPHAIQEWAKLKAALSEASQNVLEAHGHNWDSFNSLEWDALSQMTEDVVDTEFGRVQKIPDSAVQYKIRRLEKPDEPLIHKKRLKLIRNQQSQERG